MPVTSEHSAILPQNYRFLREYLHSGSGVVLDEEKHHLLSARLSGLVRELGLDSLNGLCAVMRSTGDLSVGRRVLEALVTNETYFFREPAQFDALRTTVLPAIIGERQATRKLHFWSAAASTGQEAFSLAMTLLEMGCSGWSIDILGTDLSGQALERAEAGKFSQLEVNRGLPAKLLLKYFKRSGLEWEIREEVRRMVRFQQADLRTSMRARGPFDVVLCRNVLIYFDDPTRRRIVEEIHGTLFRGGYLLLGAAESSFQSQNQFVRRAVGSATLYQAR